MTTLRPAVRSDLPTLALIANRANSPSALHRHMSPKQSLHPSSHYLWRLSILRLRLATPTIRTIVAVSPSGAILGFATWSIEGPTTSLHAGWTSSHPFSGPSVFLERQLLKAEALYARYITDKSTDYDFLDAFLGVFIGEEQARHPDCLRCHQIVVDPCVQSRGTGRRMIDWGKEVARKEGVVVYLESNLEAVAFYEKGGFGRLGEDMVIRSPGASGEGVENGEGELKVPVFAWEGEGREGRWLEEDGKGRWKWREDVLRK
ncbi:Hypothetical protein D9617_18g034540 [Elsinoe fawcettii]|nr:Hypothetical protein D9617_18g034540 [Elsinoe fawcettii]